MKNKFIFFRLTLFVIFCFIIQISSTFSKEIELKAIEILTQDEGNIIIGNNSAEAKIEEELEIYADKFTYNKKRIS